MVEEKINKAISPGEYRKKVYVEKVVEAPSGAKFKVKKLSVLKFIEEGAPDVPNAFIEFAQKGDAKALNKAMQNKDSVDFMNKILNVAIEEGVVEPKIKIKYDKKDDKKTTLYWSEIDDKDQAFLLGEILGAHLVKK